ncbi:Cytochrome P450 67 [Psilocybe cubensis]|uniref:Cytochrome P450 67 n=2 Tax=Psilocybe cubensis TaxID=181762 RepID=A0ACB8GZT2_PSICU|nr:Cytochrome P450 67 [Psilocybe cubensis]KAH9481263.1 Cytochrome P450 67 [Psilocybe cubensis]
MAKIPSVHLSHSDALLSAVFCGLSLHLLFNKLEITHITALKRILILSPLLPVPAILPHYPNSASVAILVSYGIVYGTLAASILIYRLSPIHPLAKYPGPLLAKCSQFWNIYNSYTGRTHLNHLNLHKRYGPIVRTGPNEVSVCDADVVQAILGPDGLAKGPIWSGRHTPKRKHYSLISIRNMAEHLRRRKVWNRAFSIPRIKNYEPILRKRLDQLVDALQAASRSNKHVDLAEWMSFFAYDFMGDMAFGGFFELMRDGDVDGLWKMMEKGIRVQAYTQHIPWAAPILYELPGMGKNASKLMNFVIETSKKRIERGVAFTGEDLSSHLLDEVSASPQPASFGDFSSDAFLAIVAGSDTTATVLSNIFFYILSDKMIFERLREEVDHNFPRKEGTAPSDDSTKLANMPYLNAVINEALRLQPPVPTGLQRGPEPGAEGKMVGNMFIPPGTGVYTPPYVIHRDERYFSPDPDRFWPERWLNTQPKVITNQAAFLPFSLGPMNCVGKSLAQLELRIIVATLVQQFEMDFKVGWDPANWLNDLEDCFVFIKGVLPVVLSPRA